MKYLANRKLFLASGAAIKTGGTVLGFERWPADQQISHIESGHVRAVDERTGKEVAQPHAATADVGPNKTRLASATAFAKSAGKRKAISQANRKG